MTAPNALARTAGVLYLTVAAGGTFAQFYVQSRIVASGDAAATADNVRASATLLRVGLASDLVAAVCWLLTAMVLYLLFKHVHQPVAAAMVAFVAVGLALACANLASRYTALTVATDDAYARALGEMGADALATLYVEAPGGLFAGVFFGLWLAPLGYLVIRSGYVPRVLGVLLVIGCVGYVVHVFTQLLAPDLAGPFLFAPAAVAELVFVAWLLVKGVRAPATPRPRAPALAAPA